MQIQNPLTRFFVALLPVRITLLTVFLIPLSTSCMSDPQSSVPLAYVRKIAVAPLQDTVDLPVISVVDAKSKNPKAIARNMQMRGELITWQQLKSKMRSVIYTKLLAKLSILPGITTDELLADADGDRVAEVIWRLNDDALVSLEMDRFNVHPGFERSLYVRLVFHIAYADKTRNEQMFYVYGQASTYKKILGKGYGKSDDKLLDEASAQLTRQLTHVLETGDGNPYASDAAIVVAPALVPNEVAKRFENSGASLIIAAPILARQSDVLLQPDLGPIWKVVPMQSVRAAMLKTRLASADFWSSFLQVDVTSVSSLADAVCAEYAMVSRIADLSLSEREIEVMDNGVAMTGVEKRAEAGVDLVLLRIADGKEIWRDKAYGYTSSKTAYVRHKPRIRTDEQCILDAVHAAYGQVRFSLAESRKRYER